MLFNSLAFAIFLPIVFAVYWLLPHKYRWALIFVASYYFYMSWNAKYVVLILFTTVASYSAARLMEKKDDKKYKQGILAVTTIVCLGVLFFFKYFNFLSDSLTDLLGMFSIQLHPVTLKILLPVGISFYTFQTLSYVIDVYRGSVKAERHFGKYAAFISFFPQLVAGPIERTSNLLPQIKEERKFDYHQATYGMKLMTWGFFKKLVIADVVSPYVDSIFNNPTKYSGFSLVLATLFFTIQIYCDFSGYSDIAIGTSKLLGIDLMTNFKSPYFSQSIKEFWSRWHISLSTWFKDYVYIPLGGNRCSKFRNSINLMLTFLVSGLWHGSNWTFVVWGGIHGFAQVIENRLLPKKHRTSTGLVKAIRIAFVFCFCAFAWVFFVSNSIGDAFYVITHFFTGIGDPINYIISGYSNIGMVKSVMVPVTFSICLLAVYDYISLKYDCIEIISKQKKIVRYSIYWILVIIILSIRAGGAAEFVYFQF